MVKVGDIIEIEYMNDKAGDRYVGRRGTVTKVEPDPWGDMRIEGTWGIALYPSVGDRFHIVKPADGANS